VEIPQIEKKKKNREVVNCEHDPKTERISVSTFLAGGMRLRLYGFFQQEQFSKDKKSFTFNKCLLYLGALFLFFLFFFLFYYVMLITIHYIVSF